MTIASILRSTGCAVLLAPLLLSPGLLSAQEQITAPSTPPYINAPAPVGHRQPRAADITPADKTAAELLEEKQQAELNRRLRICRGC